MVSSEQVQTRRTPPWARADVGASALRTQAFLPASQRAFLSRARARSGLTLLRENCEDLIGGRLEMDSASFD